MKRRESLKAQATRKTDELQWDFIDRCFLPVIFSHALAVAVAFILQTLRISQVSSFQLFLLFVLLSVGFTICYHNLQVSYLNFVESIFELALGKKRTLCGHRVQRLSSSSALSLPLPLLVLCNVRERSAGTP